MLNKVNDTENTLKELDDSSHEIGMGGFLDPDIKEDVYISKMKKKNYLGKITKNPKKNDQNLKKCLKKN